MWRSPELSLFKTGQMRREWGAKNNLHKGTKKQTRVARMKPAMTNFCLILILGSTWVVHTLSL